MTQRLETLTVWPMWRLQFRNFGTHEAMVVNHTVDADGNDLRASAGTSCDGPAAARGRSSSRAPTHPTGSIAGWARSPWTASGNIGLGYSVSSRTVFPSIRRTGRLASDPRAR